MSKKSIKKKITAVEALLTFMSKRRGAPVYEFLNKFGKAHKPWFRYRCIAMNETVVGTGRSKSEAKQMVAKLMLAQLSMRGYIVPPEFASPGAMELLMDQVGLPTHSFVILLKELCSRFRFDPVEYLVFADPAGQPTNFTVKARLGLVERIACGPSRRIAHNLAAEQIYRHLRSHLYAPDFQEDDVICEAYEKAMDATSDEDNADDQPNDQDELQDEAAAASSRTRRNRKKKDRRRAAAQAAAVRAAIDLEMELPQPEGSYEVGPAPLPRPPSPDLPAIPLDQRIAMNFLSRTMERLGI